ncbi:MAG: SagB/ThcOx family dehydrogenase [Synergistaceae bacterium]|nr:SagB/ThcOx family dehydrogenase [Synergistaceae bacterium]
MWKRLFVSSALVLALCAGAWAADPGALRSLPDPAREGGLPLMEALAARRSERTFADVDLSDQELSDLLWATAGVNREDGRRVHPVAMGKQDTTVYVFDRQGAWLYDARAHALIRVAEGDLRAETTQDIARAPYVASAAVTLAFVHDASLWEDVPAPSERVARWGFAHTGALMQDAGLFAASKGWSCVVRGSFDQERVAGILGLKEGQSVTLVQSIGPRS